MALAELRDSLRCNIVESRKLSRDKLKFGKRKALEDNVNFGRDITVPEVSIIGSKLKNKSTIKAQDLKLLKISFVQKAENIEAFLKVKGALHGLVRELSSLKSDHQLLAAECCCNLALGDSWACLQVAKASGPYLVALLCGGFNYNLVNVSVWTLGNLVGSGEKTWLILHSQGFLAKLLKLIQVGDNETDSQVQAEIQENSFNALVQLLRVGSKLLMPEEVESIVKTVSNLQISSGKGVQVSQFLLSCIDSAEQELIKNKVPLQCCKFLEENELTEDTLSSFTACVRTLANLVTDLSGSCAQDVFCNWNIVQDFVQRVFSSPFPHLIQEVGWLLGNLINHPSQEVQSSLQELSLDFKLFSSQLTFFSSS